MKFEYMYGIPSLVGVIFEAGINLLESPSLKADLTEMKFDLDAVYQLVLKYYSYYILCKLYT